MDPLVPDQACHMRFSYYILRKPNIDLLLCLFLDEFITAMKYFRWYLIDIIMCFLASFQCHIPIIPEELPWDYWHLDPCHAVYLISNDAIIASTCPARVICIDVVYLCVWYYTKWRDEFPVAICWLLSFMSVCVDIHVPCSILLALSFLIHYFIASLLKWNGKCEYLNFNIIGRFSTVA